MPPATEPARLTVPAIGPSAARPGAAARRPGRGPGRRRAASSSSGSTGDQGRDRHRRAARRLPGAGRPGADPRRLAGGGRAAGRHRGGARRAHRRLCPRWRSPTMAVVGAAAGYCFSVSLAPLDRWALGGALAAHHPGPAARRRRRPAGAAACNRRGSAAGRLLDAASGSPATAPRRERRTAGTAPRAMPPCAANLSLELDQLPPRPALRLGACRRRRRLLALGMRSTASGSR